MTSVSRRLVDAAYDLYHSDLPRAVLAHAKPLIVDTLLVAYAGAARHVNRELAAVYHDMGGVAEAGIWSPAHPAAPLPVAHAAFVNSLYATGLDFDSLNATVHTDAVCLPVAWGLAERTSRGGRDLLRAYIVASELMARLARAQSGASSGWSGTSIYGGAAAAMAAALLLGLDSGKTTHALGLALAQAAGTQQANIERTLAKRIQPAFAARNGVMSALLAQGGATAPQAAMEGRFGFYTLYEAGDPERLLDGWGSDYAFLGTSIKRFPVCACSHAALLACEQLVLQRKPQVADIASVSLTISPFMDRLVGGAFSTDGDLEVTAQFSIRYAIAVFLLHGRVGLEALEADWVRSRDIAAVMSRFEVVVEPSWRGELTPAIVTMALRDGTQWQSRCEALPGDAAMPHRETALRQKWRDCSAQVLTAGIVTSKTDDIETRSESAVERVVAHVDALHDTTDIPALNAALQTCFLD